MKKQKWLYCFIVLFFSCTGNDAEKQKVEAKPAVQENDLSNNADYKTGLALVAKQDCFSCQKIEDKLIGPSYSDIASKYASTPENIKILAGKIVKGVTPEQAIWGKLPMNAHPQVSQADAEQMVKYILLLKK